MAGTAETMAANQRALAAAAARWRAVFAAGVHGVAVALDAVGEATVAELQQLLSTPYPPPSEPGEPPHMRDPDEGLRSSYQAWREGNVLSVGTDKPYGP